MKISVTQETGRIPVSVFHVTGEINVSTYETLQQQARAAYDAGMRDMVIDLSGVSYISSAGIRAITSIFRMLRGTLPEETPEAMSRGINAGTFKSPHLKLAAPSGRVMEVLKLAGVDMFLEVHPSAAEAVASF